ncbi:MAG: peptidylprolyl isomerase [Acidobacteriota bacterium]
MALKAFREQLKHLKWILAFVAVGLVVTLIPALDFGGPIGSAQDVAAWVGSEEITYGEFQQQYRQLESYYRQVLGGQFNEELARQFNLRKQALDTLIDRRILLMEAKAVGLQATDTEVQNTIVETYTDEDGKFIGRERLQRLLQSNRISPKQFSEDIRSQMLLTKLDGVLAATSYVSDADVEKAFREQAEKAKIRFVQLPASEAGQVTVGADELEAYFAENANDYELPERRIASYLLVDSAKLRREIEIPEDELKAYYDANPVEFTREEQVRARHILLRVTPDRDEAATEAELAALRTRVEGGADFGQLARDLSDDEGSAQRGGSLGWFGRGAMVQPFEQAAFGAEPGTLVGPVKSDFGFHLIDVQEKRAGGLQKFEEAQALIRSRLIGERVQEIAETKANELAGRITAESIAGRDGLETLAQGEELAFETTSPFGQADAVTGIGRVADFNNAAFGLQADAISEPVKVPRGWAILHLDEVLPPEIPELAEVEDQVRGAVETAKQKEAAVDRLAEMRSQLEGGGEFSTLAEGLGLELQESAEFGRFGNITGLGNATKVVDAALGLDVGAFSEPIETSIGAVLFEVTERKTFDAAEFEEKKAETREQKASERLNQLKQSLIELRRRDLTPEYAKSLVEEFSAPPEAG